MSPRRKFRAGEKSLLVEQQLPQRHWGFPLASTVAAVVMMAAVATSALMLFWHESRVVYPEAKDREAVSYVKWFMAQFTSIDPFHANDYVERIQAQATGDFAKEYHDKANEILLQIAQAEPASGTVLEAGVERRNDDGSVNVLAVTAVTSKTPDEKQVFVNTNRWTATATQEGNQWKISNLLPVI